MEEVDEEMEGVEVHEDVPPCAGDLHRGQVITRLIRSSANEVE